MNMMMNFIVQGSSRSWAGDIEHCMNKVDGYPAIYWTIKRIYDNFDDANVILAAPEFDAQGELRQLKEHFKNLHIIYAHDSSPLLRMIEATKSLHNAHFLRVNALNFQFEAAIFKEMYQFAQDGDYDCVKLPDDYPVHFTCEIYKPSALLQLNTILASGEIDDASIHEVHPKFLLMRRPEFKTHYFTTRHELEEDALRRYREKMTQVMFSERQEVSGDKQILSGDQLTYHYDLSEQFLAQKGIVSGNILDIACGTGYGTKKINTGAFKIVGADYDQQQIDKNIIAFAKCPDITFKQEDITNISFANDSFDVALSMETIEHVEPHAALQELSRVIKNDGYLIISTPQNSSLKTCINPQHRYEYSLKELSELIAQYFTIERVTGLKAGKIHFDDDPIGANSIIFARNNKEEELIEK